MSIIPISEAEVVIDDTVPAGCIDLDTGGTRVRFGPFTNEDLDADRKDDKSDG